MKLLILSDLHVEIAQFYVPAVDYDVVVLAGDVSLSLVKVARWARRERNFGETKPIVFVPGNHEFYRLFMAAALEDMARGSEGTNFHALHCSQVVVDGVRFLGCTLWTDFAVHIDTPAGPHSDAIRAAAEASKVLSDFRLIWVKEAAEGDSPGQGAQRVARKFTPEDSIALHQQQRQWLLEKLREPFDGRTVVVTHHAPHIDSMAAAYATDWVSAAYVNELPLEFFEVPVLWVHGHTHSSFDYQINNCRVVCNPRGYMSPLKVLPKNEQFDSAFLVELP